MNHREQLDLAYDALEKGRHPEAEEAFDLALEQAVAQRDDPGEASARIGLGMLRLRFGQYALGREQYVLALAAFERMGDARQIAHMQYRLGEVERHDRRLQHAIAWFAAAESAYRALGEEQGLAYSAMGAAEAHLAAEEHQAALGRAKTAFEYAERTGMVGPAGSALRYQAFAVLELDGREVAEPIFLEAEVLSRSASDFVTQIQILQVLGEIALDRNAPQEAAERWLKGRALAESTGRLDDLGELCARLAAISVDRERRCSYVHEAWRAWSQIERHDKIERFLRDALDECGD